MVLLSFLQELLEAARRHVFCDEYNLWEARGNLFISQACESSKKEITERDLKKRRSYPRLTLLHVQPVLVELDDVGVFDLHQVLKHLLDLVLKKI